MEITKTKPMYVGVDEVCADWGVKGCIFHYEFKFIHPFADGNGRTGRLWHTLILAKWQEFFLMDSG
jgi:hypothetical protein